jgi:hypothetical protein
MFHKLRTSRLSPPYWNRAKFFRIPKAARWKAGYLNQVALKQYAEPGVQAGMLACKETNSLSTDCNGPSMQRQSVTKALRRFWFITGSGDAFIGAINNASYTCLFYVQSMVRV